MRLIDNEIIKLNTEISTLELQKDRFYRKNRHIFNEFRMMCEDIDKLELQLNTMIEANKYIESIGLDKK